MSICDHRRPDYHPAGETCRHAADLKEGDRVGVVSGVHLVVYEVRPATPGRTFLWLKGEQDGDQDVIERVPSNAVLPVRPVDGLRPEEQTEAPSALQILDLADCTRSWADGETPCYERPAFVIAGFGMGTRRACSDHAGDVLSEVIAASPDQTAVVSAYEGD